MSQSAGGPWDKVFKKLSSSVASALGDASKIVNAQETRFLKVIEHVKKNSEEIDVVRDIMVKTEKRVNSVAAKMEENLTQVDKKFEKQADIFDRKMEQQHNVIKNEINDKSKEILKVVDEKINTVSGGMKAAQDRIRKIDRTLNDTINKVKLTSNKVTTNARAVKDLEMSTNSQINRMEEFVATTIKKVEDQFTSFKNETVKSVENLDTRFQDYRFTTDQTLARKADIDDLKVKLDKVDFTEWKKNADDLQVASENKISTIESNLEEEVGERENFGEETTKNIDFAVTERKEMKHILGQLMDKKDGSEEMRRHLADLQERFYLQMQDMEERLLKKMNSMAPSRNTPAMSSLSGSCFSCGSPVGLGGFGAMPVPKTALSPQRGAAGGYVPSKSPTGKYSSRGFSQVGRNVALQESPQKLRNSSTFGDLRRPNQPLLKDLTNADYKHSPIPPNVPDREKVVIETGNRISDNFSKRNEVLHSRVAYSPGGYTSASPIHGKSGVTRSPPPSPGISRPQSRNGARPNSRGQ
eukprot:TRINITY_DN37_c0_g1_i6.p1 TRINITY_DN37_c0_g1~~TRINITY_DN37_c0_g1_i6.p1  ORF type:complete len:526 (-),score=111.82 TRINITY_DN37_c0_g1_i6:183-1760(-)